MTTATTSMMTTTTDWAETARIHDLRLAMWEWRVDPVGGRTRLVNQLKDIAREHGASDPVITVTRVYLRVSTGLRPNALAFQDLDAYAAAWRDALVKELRAYKAAVQYCDTHAPPRRGALPHDDKGRQLPPRHITRRARTARGGATPSAWRAIGQRRIEPAAARPSLSLNLDKPTAPRGLWRARAPGDLAKLSNERARLRKGPIWAYPGLKPQRSFSS
jgi:hypothetical protein